MRNFNVINKVTLLTFIILMIFILTFESVSITSLAETLDTDLKITLDESGLIKIKEKDESGKAWSELIERYKGFIVGVSGVGAVSMILLFIIQFLRLGASAGNPQERKKALIGVLWTGISAAMLGAVSLITYIAYYALN